MSSSTALHYPPQHALYTQEQLRQVYERLDVPSKYRYEPGDFSREVIKLNDGIGYLKALVRHALASIPFENLSLHYSVHHQVSIDPHVLFDKIVRRRRGGTSLENNVFFNTVLRSCGFNVYSVAARLNTRFNAASPEDHAAHIPVYSGLSHCVNLVKLHGDLYLVDIGFGAGSPIQPIQLKDNTIKSELSPGEEAHIHYMTLSNADQNDCQLWTLQRQNSTGEYCHPLYCFSSGLEFLPQDFRTMNFYASVHRQSLLLHQLICWQALLSEGLESVIGDVTLVENRIIRTVNGERQVVSTLRTEEERIEALKDVFGLHLDESEQQGIAGLVTALPLATHDPEDSDEG